VTLEDVLQTKQSLEAIGVYPSADAILKALGAGSKKTLLKYLRTLPAANHANGTSKPEAEPVSPMAPPAPVMVQPPPPPTPLLQQAEEALEAALMAERRARRDYDMAPRSEKPRLEEAWVAARRTREHAATLVEQRRRAKDRLLAALPSAHIEARRATGELAVLQAETNRRLVKAEREATLAQQDLDRIMQDLAQIAGVHVIAEAAS
jgi:hypothetical protein